jgi:hypothetical protein
MNIYLFFLLTILLGLFACWIGLLFAELIATNHAGRTMAAIFSFILSVTIGIGIPGALWYAVFQYGGGLQGSHNSGGLVLLAPMILIGVVIACARRGAESIMKPREDP